MNQYGWSGATTFWSVAVAPARGVQLARGVEVGGSAAPSGLDVIGLRVRFRLDHRRGRDGPSPTRHVGRSEHRTRELGVGEHHRRSRGRCSERDREGGHTNDRHPEHAHGTSLLRLELAVDDSTGDLPDLHPVVHRLRSG